MNQSMKVFESESSNLILNISEPEPESEPESSMNTPHPPHASENQSASQIFNEIFMKSIQEIFEISTSQTLQFNQSNQSNLIELSPIQFLISSSISNHSNLFNSKNLKNLKLLFFEEKRPTIKPIKKRKSGKIDEILLFSLELSQQKAKLAI